MFPDSPAMREHDRRTAEAFADPRPGDRFHEMFSAWVVVVSVGIDGVRAMEGHGPVNVVRGRFPSGELVEPFPERAEVRWYATADDFRDAFRYRGIPGYSVMLADRGLDVSGWLARAREVPSAPTHPKPPAVPAPDPPGDELDAIEWGVRFTIGSVAEQPCHGEADARAVVASMREDKPEWGARVIWRTAARPAGEWNEEATAKESK